MSMSKRDFVSLADAIRQDLCGNTQRALGGGTMKVKYDNLWACVDCTMYLANGDIPAERPNLPAEIHGQWPHDTDLVLGDNADEFSWRQCDCCGSKLGGSRTAFAVLG